MMHFQLIDRFTEPAFNPTGLERLIYFWIFHTPPVSK